MNSNGFLKKKILTLHSIEAKIKHLAYKKYNTVCGKYLSTKQRKFTLVRKQIKNQIMIYLVNWLGFPVPKTGDCWSASTLGDAASLLYWHIQNSLHGERS